MRCHQVYKYYKGRKSHFFENPSAKYSWNLHFWEKKPYVLKLCIILPLKIIAKTKVRGGFYNGGRVAKIGNVFYNKTFLVIYNLEQSPTRNPWVLC